VTGCLSACRMPGAKPFQAALEVGPAAVGVVSAGRCTKCFNCIRLHQTGMRLIEVWHADRLWRSLWIAAETLTSNWAYWLESLQRRQLFFGPCFKWRVRKRNKKLTNGQRMSKISFVSGIKVPSIPFLSWNVPKISRDHYWSLGPRLNPFWVMGGLPVKSWMKVETYGQTCLNLRPEAGRMAKMFLEPVSRLLACQNGIFLKWLGLCEGSLLSFEGRKQLFSNPKCRKQTGLRTCNASFAGPNGPENHANPSACLRPGVLLHELCDAVF
jgi:hypothetical protein